MSIRPRPILALSLVLACFVHEAVFSTPIWATGKSSTPSAPPKATATAQSVRARVEEANRYANEDNFSKAIAIYEEVTRQLPNEGQLKNNLAILYANYAAQLQQQQLFTQANEYFDKSLRLLPGEKQVLKQKCNNFLEEGVTLLNADSTEYDKIRGKINQAIATCPDDKVYKNWMASVYLKESHQQAEAGAYEASLALLDKGLTYEPDGKTLRQSKVNILLKLAQESHGDLDKRKQWLDQATSMDSSPVIMAKVEAIKNVTAPSSMSQSSSQTFPKPASSTATLKAVGPAITKLSIDEMLKDIEKQLELTPENKATLKDRLESAENQLYGKPQEGALNLRTKTLYAALFGQSTVGDQGSKPDLAQAPVEVSDDAYLDAIFKVTEGRVVRWGKFPLRVYIEDPPKEYEAMKTPYIEAVKAGMDQWKEKTQNFVSYVVVKNQLAADVQIGWAEAYTDRFADIEEVPDYFKKYAVPKASPMLRVMSVASMLAPGYFSLAPQAIGAAMQYQQAKKLQVLIDESKITLGLGPLKGMEPDDAKRMLQNMTAHEFGHVLGLKAHSPESGDLMFPILKNTDLESPSARDIETLRQLYGRPANIVLNIR